MSIENIISFDMCHRLKTKNSLCEKHLIYIYRLIAETHLSALVQKCFTQLKQFRSGRKCEGCQMLPLLRYASIFAIAF